MYPFVDVFCRSARARSRNPHARDQSTMLRRATPQLMMRRTTPRLAGDNNTIVTPFTNPKNVPMFAALSVVGWWACWQLWIPGHAPAIK
jgi:hypothetical protein